VCVCVCVRACVCARMRMRVCDPARVGGGMCGREITGPLYIVKWHCIPKAFCLYSSVIGLHCK
jgi:hypothetical protein